MLRVFLSAFPVLIHLLLVALVMALVLVEDQGGLAGVLANGHMRKTSALTTS